MRMISGNTDIPWPARSPDKSPLDYYLWGGCEAEVRRVKPNNLEELKEWSMILWPPWTRTRSGEPSGT